MGIQQSVNQYNGESDEESTVSSLNSDSSGEKLGYARQWQNGNGSTLCRQMKHVTISVPDLKDSPSLAHTSVNTTIKSSSAVSIKKITPQNGEERRRKEGTQPLINCTVVAPEERWIKHYSSCHRILLVGEGDFSFSTCLAAAFGMASNMIATSLNSEDFLVKNYQNALSNLVELSIRKCRVMHEIDATKMAKHPSLSKTKFDRIIFNFPFAGFFKGPRDYQLRLHRGLVSQFLMNAKEMVSENGEIHISHKTNGFHMEWKVESIASSHKLRLVEAVDFDLLDYPGYNTKCGFGGDNNFNCYPSKTYKFGVKSSKGH